MYLELRLVPYVPKDPLVDILKGHKEELWGLDVSPSQSQFLTCGYDKHVYLWDAQTRSVVWRKEISVRRLIVY